MGDNFGDGFQEFLEVFEQERKKMAAVECFAEIMKYVTRANFDETNSDSMDGLIEILINYAEKETMNYVAKQGGL